MKNVLAYLQQLNFSKIEAQLYVLLLQYGPLTVTELAEKAKINRTAAYPHIKSLINKSIFLEIIQHGVKRLVAVDPDRLQIILDNQLAQVQARKANFPTILTSLNTLIPEKSVKNISEITYLKGIENVKKIYQEAFKSNEFRSFVRVEDQPLLSNDNISYFRNAFVKNSNLKIWEIVYESPFSKRQAMKVLADNIERYQFRFMPKSLNWSITSEDILIYDGNVAIIDYHENVSIILLQSSSFYHNFKELFNFIWQLLPDPFEK